MPATHWARKSIGLAAYLGWINGTDGGRFEPDRDISRAEAAKVVNRILRRKPDAGYIAAHAADLLRFPDITDKHWAWAEIMEAVNTHGHTAKDGEETWTGLQ